MSFLRRHLDIRPTRLMKDGLGPHSGGMGTQPKSQLFMFQTFQPDVQLSPASRGPLACHLMAD